jgi:hypothetical protein
MRSRNHTSVVICEINIPLTRYQRFLGNRVLRRIFGPKSDEATGERRRLQNEELHNLYSSPNIIRHIHSRRMRWAEHVAHMGEEREV